MSRITIPPSALEKGAMAAHDKWRHDCAAADHGFIADVSEWRTWKELETWERQEWLDQTRAAFLAIVEAWPGKDIVGYGPPFYGIDLILPLAEQEQTDDKA